MARVQQPSAVAVVGTGSIGRRHLANFRELGCRVIGVSEHRRTTSIDLDGGPIPCMPSLAHALAQGVDAVVVANPTSMHRATASEAIAAGASVYLEKPAATSGTECAELAAEARRAGVVVAVGHQLRFHPLVAGIAELLGSGVLGRILAVEANWGEHLADYHPEEDYRTSYAARRELGGGVLLTQIHLPDLLTVLFGPFRSVLAHGGHRSDLEVDVEDAVSFLARAEDETPVYAHLDYCQRPKRSFLGITGTLGRAEVDLQAQTLTFLSGTPGSTPSLQNLPVERNELFLATAADFLRSACTARPPRCDLVQATQVLDLVDSIRASMATGQVTNVVARTRPAPHPRAR